MSDILLKTNDGRETTIEQMQTIFARISADMHNWKMPIDYTEQYQNADRSNDIMSAIEFMVGGKCEVIARLDTTTMVLYITYKNAGYYNNIGA